MPRSGGQNEIIVIEFAIDHFYLPRIHIDRLNFSEDHLHVFAFAQNRSHGSGNIRRRKRSGRDLIKQRLKQMVIRPVDHRNLDGSTGEFLGRLQAAEPGADNHDARNFRGGGFHI